MGWIEPGCLDVWTQAFVIGTQATVAWCLLHTQGKGFVSPAELGLLFMHLANLGYAVVSRDDNAFCKHCSELVVIRLEGCGSTKVQPAAVWQP